jgi:hypothetical protein
MPECDGNYSPGCHRCNASSWLRWYKRFAPQNARGAIGDTLGVRGLIVGTGGAGLERQEGSSRLSRVLNASIHDIVMTFHSGSYGWQFTKRRKNIRRLSGRPLPW